MSRALALGSLEADDVERGDDVRDFTPAQVNGIELNCIEWIRRDARDVAPAQAQELEDLSLIHI